MEATQKNLIVNGRTITFEWTPDPEGLGGTAQAPGVVAFHADSPADARETLFSLYQDGER